MNMIFINNYHTIANPETSGRSDTKYFNASRNESSASARWADSAKRISAHISS